MAGPAAVVVQGVPVLQAVVLVALLADHLHHLLLLAAGLQALVGEDLALALRGVGLAVAVDVLAHQHVGHLPAPHGHRRVAERAHGDLNVLLVGGGAGVLGVGDVVGAEDLLAGVALEGQEIR